MPNMTWPTTLLVERNEKEVKHTAKSSHWHTWDWATSELKQYRTSIVTQLIETLCSVYFKLTLSVRPKTFTSLIVSLSITDTKSRIVLRMDSRNSINGIQISVCNVSHSKGMTYRLHNVPKYRTYPTYGQKVIIVIDTRGSPQIYIMWRMDSNDASLSAMSVVVRNPYNKGDTQICSIWGRVIKCINET